MVSGARWPYGLGVLGLGLLVLGALVLRSRGARDVGFGWFAYSGEPPSATFLDGLTAWNLARGLGAVLVVVGLGLVVLAGTALLARRHAFARRVVTTLAVVGVVLVVGGAAGFPAIGAAERSEATVAIGKAQGMPRHVAEPFAVWSQGQAGAALVVVAGLVAGAAALGLRTGRRLSAPASGSRTAS